MVGRTTSPMPSTTTLLQDLDAPGVEPQDLDGLRDRLRQRAERRREAFMAPAKELAALEVSPMLREFIDALDRLRLEHPLAATTLEYHYLARASLRSIALATGRSEADCTQDLRMARAWLTRTLKSSPIPS